MAATQTTNLEVPLIDPFQSRKDITANEGTNALVKAISETLTVNAGAVSSPYTLPYEATAGGDKTALRFIQLRLTGSPGGAFVIVHPASPHLFFVANTTEQPATVRCSGETGSVVPAGETMLAYCDGTDVEVVSVGGAVALTSFLALSDTPGAFVAHKRVKINAGADAIEFADQPYDIKVFIPGTIGAGQLVLRDVAMRDYQIPHGLDGSQGYIGTHATASGYFSVRRNGTEVVRINFSDGSSAVSFTAYVAGPYDFEPGDRLEVFAPASADDTLADVSLGILGILKE